MDSHPLAGPGAGAHPYKKSADSQGHGRQRDRPMGQGAVEVDGRDVEREFGQDETHQNGNHHRPGQAETVQEPLRHLG